MTELITIKDLKVHYPIRSGFFNRVTDHVYAVDGVDFIIEKGKPTDWLVSLVLVNPRRGKPSLD